MKDSAINLAIECSLGAKNYRFLFPLTAQFVEAPHGGAAVHLADVHAGIQGLGFLYD